MSQNFRLFHVSNLSVRNFRIFLLMYPGSLPCYCCRLVGPRRSEPVLILRPARLSRDRSGCFNLSAVVYIAARMKPRIQLTAMQVLYVMRYTCRAGVEMTWVAETLTGYSDADVCHIII